MRTTTTTNSSSSTRNNKTTTSMITSDVSCSSPNISRSEQLRKIKELERAKLVSKQKNARNSNNHSRHRNIINNNSSRLSSSSSRRTTSDTSTYSRIDASNNEKQENDHNDKVKVDKAPNDDYGDDSNKDNKSIGHDGHNSDDSGSKIKIDVLKPDKDLSRAVSLLSIDLPDHTDNEDKGIIIIENENNNMKTNKQPPTLLDTSMTNKQQEVPLSTAFPESKFASSDNHRPPPQCQASYQSSSRNGSSSRRKPSARSPLASPPMSLLGSPGNAVPPRSVNVPNTSSSRGRRSVSKKKSTDVTASPSSTKNSTKHNMECSDLFVSNAIEDVEELIEDAVLQLSISNTNSLSSSEIVSNLKEAMERLEELKSNNLVSRNAAAAEQQHMQEQYDQSYYEMRDALREENAALRNAMSQAMSISENGSNTRGGERHQQYGSYYYHNRSITPPSSVRLSQSTSNNISPMAQQTPHDHNAGTSDAFSPATAGFYSSSSSMRRRQQQERRQRPSIIGTKTFSPSLSPTFAYSTSEISPVNCDATTNDYPIIQSSHGTKFVTELSQLLDLKEGHHASLASIMDKAYSGS